MKEFHPLAQKETPILIVALTFAQGMIYKQNMFKNSYTIIATPDHIPVGHHPTEIWIVGELCKIHRLFKEISALQSITAKVHFQPELPNTAGI